MQTSPSRQSNPQGPQVYTRPAGSPRRDPTQLRRHRADCVAARSQLHGLRSAVEAVDAFLSPRFFTTLAVLAASATLLLWLSA